MALRIPSFNEYYKKHSCLSLNEGQTIFEKSSKIQYVVLKKARLNGIEHFYLSNLKTGNEVVLAGASVGMNFSETIDVTPESLWQKLMKRFSFQIDRATKPASPHPRVN